MRTNEAMMNRMTIGLVKMIRPKTPIDSTQTPLFHLLHFLLPSFMIALRAPQGVRSPAQVFARCTSTISGSTILEAKSRLRHRTRSISRSTIKNAFAAPATYVFLLRTKVSDLL
jgi:hypothetical protein